MNPALIIGIVFIVGLGIILWSRRDNDERPFEKDEISLEDGEEKESMSSTEELSLDQVKGTIERYVEGGYDDDEEEEDLASDDEEYDDKDDYHSYGSGGLDAGKLVSGLIGMVLMFYVLGTMIDVVQEVSMETNITNEYAIDNDIFIQPLILIKSAFPIIAILWVTMLIYRFLIGGSRYGGL